MLYLSETRTGDVIKGSELESIVCSVLSGIGERKRVLIVPPDITRLHSGAGAICAAADRYYGGAVKDILPALGTHMPMTGAELTRMFPGVAESSFRVHDWRSGLSRMGVIPAAEVSDLSGGLSSVDFPVDVNSLIARGGHDLILSIGQVVPHEVVGFANFTKNIIIGTGGREAINISHYLGACAGLENIMGRRNNPVRRLLDEAWRRYLRNLPIIYILTVVGPVPGGGQGIRGIFAGYDGECFDKACRLSAEININLLDEPVERVFVRLDPDEYRTTWLGNKAIYRTRMAVRDGGELVILAPGVAGFGEDRGIDAVIRKYGYCGAAGIMKLVEREPELAANLGAAAHLIHGSADGRFRITYCADKLGRQALETAGYGFRELSEAEAELSEIKNSGRERILYIENPALGLWAARSRFGEL